jgi:hypothetical protein
MTLPLKLEDILSEFSEDADAWVLRDRASGKYVIIPDPRFPGRKPIRFFMRREDAMDLLQELNEENPALRDKELYPSKVKLLESIRQISSDTNPANADAFVVHSPNEVYEYIRDRQ